MVCPGHVVNMRPRHLWYDQCINGGVAWLCKSSLLAQYSAIPRGQDSEVPDHAYTIIVGAKDGLNKIHVQSRSQLLSCPGHIQTISSSSHKLHHAKSPVTVPTRNKRPEAVGKFCSYEIFTRNMFFDTSTASNGNQQCFDGIRGTKFSSTCYISCCLSSLPHVIELNHQNVNQRVRRML